MHSCSLYPDVDKLPTTRIRQKLKDGNSATQTGFSLASKTIARILHQNSQEQPIESLLAKLEQNSLLEHAGKDNLIARQNSIERLCVFMQDKCQSDLQLFLSMLQDNAELTMLTTFVNTVIGRCGDIENELKSGKEPSSNPDAALPSDAQLILGVPKRFDDDGIHHIDRNKLQFQKDVLLSDMTVTSVKKHCIEINLKVANQWELENLKSDIASGAFQNRLVAWLREKGLNLTEEEANSITVDIEAKLDKKHPPSPASGVDLSLTPMDEDKPDTDSSGSDKEGDESQSSQASEGATAQQQSTDNTTG